MKKALILSALAIVVAVLASGDASACQTCIARMCSDGGPRQVCEEFPPPGQGCVSSGDCPLLFACDTTSVTAMVARVEVDSAQNLMLATLKRMLPRTLAAIREAGDKLSRHV
jgi:hypothetical protein